MALTHRSAQKAQALAEDMIKLLGRAAEAERAQVLLQRHHRSKTSSQPNRERMTEREFVRSFGDKVKHVRYSNRADFVGLLLVGKFHGILITQNDSSGERRVRLVDVNADNTYSVTRRYLRVKSNDSITNLQRGLLRYVR